MKTHHRYLLLLLTSFFILVACSKKDDEDKVQTAYVNSWILENMRKYYLWNDKIPANTNKTLSPDSYFYSLLYKYGQLDGDRFSWIQKDYTDLIKMLSGVVKEAGYEFKFLLLDDINLLGFICYVKPNSPAASAGLKRGDLYTKINGKQITLNNWKELLNETSENHTLGLATSKDLVIMPTDNIIKLQTVEYHENPIFLDTVYTINNKKIGYLVYNFFAADDGDNTINYTKQLNSVFGKFKSSNINELILDLRYNSGGLVSSAVYLASMIVKNLNPNNIIIKRQYNDALQASILEDGYGANFLVNKFERNLERTDKNGNVLETIPINNVNLSRLYVITGSSTASASELIINGLKPYIDVYLVGDVTAGKNVGSITITDQDKQGNINHNNKWGMQPIVFKFVNSEGFGDFEEGFKPDAILYEYGNLTNVKPLGDTSEILLSATLNYIFTGQTSKALKSNSSINIKSLPTKALRGTYLDKNEFSQIKF